MTIKRNFCFTILILITSSVVASQQSVNQLRQIAPDEYNSTRQMCVQWAEDDQVATDDYTDYVNDCILNAIGYLLQDVAQEEVNAEIETETELENAYMSDTDTENSQVIE